MLRVETPASILLGPQEAALLQRIRETGSIAAAGRLMGMDYNQAWYKVHTLSVAAYKSLMTTIVGGKAGGRTQLTPVGAAILDSYQRAETASEYVNKHELGALQVASKEYS